MLKELEGKINFFIEEKDDFINKLKNFYEEMDNFYKKCEREERLIFEFGKKVE